MHSDACNESRFFWTRLVHESELKPIFEHEQARWLLLADKCEFGVHRTLRYYLPRSIRIISNWTPSLSYMASRLVVKKGLERIYMIGFPVSVVFLLSNANMLCTWHNCRTRVLNIHQTGILISEEAPCIYFNP